MFTCWWEECANECLLVNAIPAPHLHNQAAHTRKVSTSLHNITLAGNNN